VRITTTEMHTGGEPVRIVTGGFPEVRGRTILAKRQYVREHLDHLRLLLMHEPRGHADMYGVLPVEPDVPDADLAVLFMHNEGYSTMCGHAVIALGRWAVDSGLVGRAEPVTDMVIQCPCGPVPTRVAVDGGRTGDVTFESVPAFVLAQDLLVDVPGHGTIEVDLAYGGAFYAFLPADRVGLDVRTAPTRLLADAAASISEAVGSAVRLEHPGETDLAFLYGTILTDGTNGAGTPSANICVFADRQVDRSPTGSGVTARMALQVARGEASLGDLRRFAGPTGTEFTGRAIRSASVGDRPAVVVEVGGRAHYTGTSIFTLENDDPLPGFLLA
jgi:trans-L-3-hydroxyproline dehydratase